MRANEFLNEISHADSVGELPISDKVIIEGSIQVGDIDGQDIYAYKSGDTVLYFFKEPTKIVAYIIIQNGRYLRAAKRNVSTGGYITALMMWFFSNRSDVILISADEPMTDDGFKWIGSVMKNTNRFAVTDQFGDPIDYDKLGGERRNAKNADSGPTEIVIKYVGRKVTESRYTNGIIPVHIHYILDKDMI